MQKFLFFFAGVQFVAALVFVGCAFAIPGNDPNRLAAEAVASLFMIFCAVAVLFGGIMTAHLAGHPYFAHRNTERTSHRWW